MARFSLRMPTARFALGLIALISVSSSTALAQRTVKPVLHGEHWMAITGKPLAATAGALTFNRGGNAVDAACAMLAATATMWDTLGWGGETQALIYNPHTGEVKGINALGVAPTGATPEFFHGKGMVYPPEYGPLAAVTPGTPGGLMVMLAEYGKLSLAEVLAPAMEMARGYPIEKAQADNIESRRELLATWPGSKKVFLPHFDANDKKLRAAQALKTANDAMARRIQQRLGESNRRLPLLEQIDESSVSKLVEINVTKLAEIAAQDTPYKRAEEFHYAGPDYQVPAVLRK